MLGGWGCGGDAFADIDSVCAAFRAIMATFWQHFYNRAEERKRSTPLMCTAMPLGILDPHRGYECAITRQRCEHSV